MEGLALASTKTRVTPFALCSDVVGKVAKESDSPAIAFRLRAAHATWWLLFGCLADN